jgi:hypothetical protein
MFAPNLVDGKQRLRSAIDQIAPVRNEIAHVREVDRDRLLRAGLACTDVLEMLKDRTLMPPINVVLEKAR